MVEVVSNSPEYYEFIRNLRNDPRVKDGFIQPAHITPEQQEAYMSEHADEYVVGVVDGEAAGFAGSVDGDIRVCTHPDYQGMGVARAMIEEVLKRFPDSDAKVKVENTASLRLFESCGFVPQFVILRPPTRGGSSGTNSQSA